MYLRTACVRQCELTLESLSLLFERSLELEEHILGILDLSQYEPAEPSLRCEGAVDLAFASIEHGRALRALVSQELFTPAFCLLRPQFEALVRAAWAAWAAREMDIHRLSAPLTVATEKDASKLPSLSDMLKQLRVSHAPPPMVEELLSFREASLPALNSFVHSGIHVMTRQAAGYSSHLVAQVVRQSNALMTMSGMLLAVLASSEVPRVQMKSIQLPFADCLPQLLARN